MKRIQSLVVLSLLLVLAPFTTSAHAALELAPIFDNHVVLQKGAPIRLWGKADKGQYVNVTLVGLKKWGEPGEVDPFAAPFVERQIGVNVSDNGTWSVDIEAVADAGHYELVVNMGQQTIIVEDVLVGDVYAVLGQGDAGSVAPGEGVRVGTAEAWSDEAGSFPAAAIEFGNAMAEKSGVPVGLVAVNPMHLIGPAGGLTIQGFVSLDGTAAPAKDVYKPVEGCNCSVYDAAGKKISAACTKCADGA